MSLFYSLMKYKTEGRLISFDMYETKKATIHLRNGKSLIVYMADQYIVGESEVVEAAEAPPALYLLYNEWDTVGQSALKRANNLNIKVYKFGAFRSVLDQLNA